MRRKKGLFLPPLSRKRSLWVPHCLRRPPPRSPGCHTASESPGSGERCQGGPAPCHRLGCPQKRSCSPAESLVSARSAPGTAPALPVPAARTAGRSCPRFLLDKRRGAIGANAGVLWTPPAQERLLLPSRGGRNGLQPAVTPAGWGRGDPGQRQTRGPPKGHGQIGNPFCWNKGN